jgi:predicted transcriptional regulator
MLTFAENSSKVLGQALVKRGILKKDQAGGRSTSYSLTGKA